MGETHNLCMKTHLYRCTGALCALRQADGFEYKLLHVIGFDKEKMREESWECERAKIERTAAN